jgi:hypothetical protein
LGACAAVAVVTSNTAPIAIPMAATGSQPNPRNLAPLMTSSPRVES